MDKKILLVEDDPFLIDIYTTRLKEEGYSVEVSTSGSDCLKKISKENFDLLILDLILPDMNGLEVLKKINEKKESFMGLKIIILSNIGDKKEIEEGIRLGADKYLIKAHHTPSDIIKEIKNLLK
jgi:DNA-binding response OmpR family regulator